MSEHEGTGPDDSAIVRWFAVLSTASLTVYLFTGRAVREATTDTLRLIERLLELLY